MFFILGGARSGKSAYALKLAESITGKRLYLATAEALDKEMAERIKKHKKERSNRWETKEEPIKVAEAIAQDKKHNVILLDCLTLWISNLMHNSAIRNPQSAISKLVSASKNSKANIIVVSNEVGLGIVPDNPLARRFRDIAGYANQKMAEAADEVYFVVSRIGMRMK
ncbi:MAG: bifunctional adenosylcobinamide kinase/adenosylcobinamide-phosphate guanylyltransferase [Deltaproteobacteria bacterium]|nr:bifunctional adenosylcobinamide kinase/adenosylcobinamide-phosphate guanylyltransferase [Deltaproteobacteria bacterium]